MVAALWGLLVVSLAAAAAGLAVLRPGRVPRTLPADLFRFATLLAVAWAVDVSLGVLATMAAWPWARAWWRGVPWERVATGTLWPTVAGAVWLGLQAHAWALDVALVALLGMGVVQVGVAAVQWARGGAVCGTLGQHTKLGIYLALLSPLSLLAMDGPWLALLFGGGAALSRSFTAAAAWGVGMLVVRPAWWPGILLLAAVGVLARAVKVKHGRWRFRRSIKTWRSRPGTTEGRWEIWRETWGDLRGWAWLTGYGAGAFAVRMPRLRGPRQERFREAHNDYLEFLYEYGAVGVLAAVWWLWRFGAFALGDPPTGGVAALFVAMTTSFPLKVAPLACVGLLVAILLMRRTA